ncbi:hypothetical protein JCM33374_g3373 [Metschnikowia sp. JCM 33374]|nr:hypothetical protein JCM33374_g3373 [Metschnikowia sp. JCM 33374]
MAKKKFDKKNAKTFSVVHRSHDDALYFDNDAPQHVLVESAHSKKYGPGPNGDTSTSTATSKSVALDTQELARRLNPTELQEIRENEGLAAQYGILYDDSKYDYMQHLRPMGQSGDGVFIEAVDETKAARPKKRIEDLLKDALPSETTRRVAHDELENIPRDLQRFNPDMDPRLREVLEALDDEAYVENEAEGEDDIFGDLLQSGAVDEDEFYSDDGGDYDEWDMDNYDDEFDGYDSDYAGEKVELDNPYGEGEAPEDFGHAAAAETVVDNAWERDFQKFKKSQKNKINDWDSDDDFDGDDLDGEAAEAPDTVSELPTIGGASSKKKKNKLRKKMGAMTDTSSFSMSSSALFRTEGLTLLDDRFEQLSKKFEEEEYQEEEERPEFNMADERGDLEDMLDEFLDNYELDSGGRKLVKKDKRLDALKEAADSVSKGKAAQRRKKEQEQGDSSVLGGLGSSFGNLVL